MAKRVITSVSLTFPLPYGEFTQPDYPGHIVSVSILRDADMCPRRYNNPSPASLRRVARVCKYARVPGDKYALIPSDVHLWGTGWTWSRRDK